LVDARYILGCALFVDVLSPCAIFSKVMQADEIDILGALTSLLRTQKEIEKLQSLPFSQWPVYSSTLKKITDNNGKKYFQGQELKRFNEAVTYFENHGQEYCLKLRECLRSRLGWSDQQLLRDIITLLATQGWEKLLIEESDAPQEGIERLIARFTIPLEGASIDCTKIQEEFKVMAQYAVQFVSLSTLEYRSVWWRLFHSPSSSEWSNVLGLVTLLLSIPASNGKLERAFSQMNIIKTSKRSLMSNDSLDDLLLLTLNEVPLNRFSPDTAIDLWWKDKQRRPNQQKRKKYKQRNPNSASPQVETSSSESEEEDHHDLLSDWDSWMAT